MSAAMGTPEDFKKALKDTFTDPEVLSFIKDAFKSVLKEDIDDLRRDFTNDLKEELGELRKEIGTLRDVIKAKDSKIEKLESKVKCLESSFDDLEQYSRRNSVRISGIPETGTDENIEARVLDLFQHKMGVDTSVEEIDRLHRVGRRGARPRAVLVKFATYRAQQAVFRAKRYLKPGAPRPVRDAPAWTLGHATGLNGGGPGPAQGQGQIIADPKEPFNDVFISEDLTEFRQNLLSKCRQARRNGCISDCWSYDGQVIVKDNSARITRMKCVDEIPSTPAELNQSQQVSD